MELTHTEEAVIKATYSDYHAGAMTAEEALGELERLINADTEIELSKCCSAKIVDCYCDDCEDGSRATMCIACKQPIVEIKPIRKFLVPFEEYQRGWYVIEAESLEEAKAIVIEGDFTEDHEPFYKDGRVDYDENDIQEMKESN
jgi:hypothetical protein